jgi:LacI family transcriptional regulator
MNFSKRPTLADVAKALGVSTMTISRAMNNKPGVGDDLRQQILALAAEMGFQPSQVARSLVTRQSGMIGLVVPDISNPFFAQIARGVEDVAYENGYCLFLVNTAENLERESVAYDSLWQKEVEGVILCSARIKGDNLRKQVQRFPAVVLVNRELEDPMPNAVTINVNDERGAQLALRHFVRKNLTQIAFIAGPPNSISAQRRLEGYRVGLREAKLPYDSQMMEYCAPTIEGGQAAAATILTRRPDLNAIFAFNDLTAIGAILACQEAGKAVPDDVAVIGADDIYLTNLFRPNLTTLHVNLVHIGRTAMRTLLDIIQLGASSATFKIEPQLIQRESA